MINVYGSGDRIASGQQADTAAYTVTMFCNCITVFCNYCV